MRGLTRLAWIEFKLFLREPAAAFFTLVFPLMMLFVFGAIFGNQPSQWMGGLGYMDVTVPAYTAMIIATTGLISISIIIASYREQGILRRLHATPLRPAAILTAQLVVLFVVTGIGVVLLMLAGKLVYNVRFFGSWPRFAFGYLLSTLSLFTIGFVIAGLARTARTAQIVAMVVYYPMLFLSGAALPRELLTGKLQQAAQLLPLTHVVNLLRGLWFGAPLVAHAREIGILVAIFIVGLAVSVKTFRWE